MLTCTPNIEIILKSNAVLLSLVPKIIQRSNGKKYPKFVER